MLEKIAETIGDRIAMINDALYIEYSETYKDGIDEVLLVNKEDFALIYYIYPLLIHSKEIHDSEWFSMQHSCMVPKVIEGENGDIVVYSILYYLCHKDNNYAIRYDMKQHEYLTGLTVQNYQRKAHEYIHGIVAKIVETKNIKSNTGSIYILEKEDGLCKIGCSISPKKRLRQIETQGGLEVKNQYISHHVINYKKIEYMIHEEMKDVRCKGEWFDICFRDAVSVATRLIDSYGEKIDEDNVFHQSIIERYKTIQSAKLLFYMFNS